MATQTINYTDKVALNENQDIATINKITDDDMNEIKSVVNNNASETSSNATDITKLQTYSTSEIDTGKTWIDGKHIYKKTYTGNAVKSNKVILENSAPIDKIISAYGSSTSLYDWCWTIPNSSSGYEITCRMMTNTHELQLSFGSNYTTSNTFVVTVEYTKTS